MGSFNTVHWVILAALVAGVFFLVKSERAPRVASFCMECGTQGAPVTKYKSSLLGEIGVYLVFLCFALATGIWWVMVLPIGFSLWRSTTRSKVCAACSSPRLVPEDAPAAEARRRDFAAPVLDRSASFEEK